MGHKGECLEMLARIFSAIKPCLSFWTIFDVHSALGLKSQRDKAGCASIPYCLFMDDAVLRGWFQVTADHLCSLPITLGPKYLTLSSRRFTH